MFTNATVTEISISNAIYFDMNILIELKKDADLYKKVKDIISANGFNPVYSAAHLEEIRNRRDERKSFIKFINQFTNQHAIRGLWQEKPLLFVCEDASHCMERVLSDDGDVTTDNVETFDYTYIMGKRNELHDNSISVEIGNLKASDIFTDKRMSCYVEEIEDLMMKLCFAQGYRKGYKYKQLKNKPFQVLEAYVELLMKYLNIAGYRADKIKCLMHSSTHDISHVHYASVAKVFVTNDKKLIDKASAVYSYLNIPTEVLPLDDFMVKYGLEHVN